MMGTTLYDKAIPVGTITVDYAGVLINRFTICIYLKIHSDTKILIRSC